MILQHEFIELVPPVLEDGVLYISVEYCSAIHKCVCGCGNKVVTPLSPTDWELTFDGKNVSLSPSIGNWNFDCRSHYWIVKNEIRFSSGRWTDKEIENGRKQDKDRKRDFYAKKGKVQKEVVHPIEIVKPRLKFWKLKNLLSFLGIK